MEENKELMSKSQTLENIPKTRRRTFFFMFLLLFGSVGMDQLTKSLAEKNFLVWESKESLSHYEGRRLHLWTLGTKEISKSNDKFYVSFAFNYVRNQGAAWGLFSTLKESIRKPLFHLITIFATLFIYLYWRSTPVYCRLTRFALLLVFSGALGNFTDRFRRGFVVDFLDVSWSIPFPFKLDFSLSIFPKFLDFLNFSINANRWAYDFPKFNWADSCITVGVAFLLIDMLFFEKKRNQKVLAMKEAETVSSEV